MHQSQACVRCDKVPDGGTEKAGILALVSLSVTACSEYRTAAEFCPIIIYVHFCDWAAGNYNSEPFEDLGKGHLLAISVFFVGQIEF
jgi:hypothetical protein